VIIPPEPALAVIVTFRLPPEHAPAGLGRSAWTKPGRSRS